MMRWKTLLTLALFAGVGLACSDGEQGLTGPGDELTAPAPLLSLMEADQTDLPTYRPDFEFTKSDPFIVDLIADGGDPGIDVGEVRVWNDDDYLYVHFVLDDAEWCMTETHVAAIGSTTWTEAGYANKPGNPQVGGFPAGEEFDVCQEVEAGPYSLMFEEIPGIPGYDGGDLMIAAHAALRTVQPVESFDGTILMSNLDDDPDNTSLFGPLDEYQGPAYESWPGPVASREYKHPNYPDGPGDWLMPDVDFDPAVDSYWLFRDGFTIPEEAENLTGQIFAVADNAEEVWFGDAKLTKSDDDCNSGVMFSDPPEESGNNYSWKYICAYDFTPGTGLNDLALVVRNYGLSGSTMRSNPVAISYAADVSYDIYRYETAWGEGVRFVDQGNWAMYFGYTPDFPLTYTCPAPDLQEGDNVVWIQPPTSVAEGVSESESGQLFAESVFMTEQRVDVDEGEVDAGSAVCTYYLHGDTPGDDLQRLGGTVHFEDGTNILGVAYTGSDAGTNTVESCQGVYRLYDTDQFGYADTTYPELAVQPHRGLECGAQDGTPPFLSDPAGVTFSFDLGVAEATDGIRFFLEAVEFSDGS